MSIETAVNFLQPELTFSASKKEDLTTFRTLLESLSLAADLTLELEELMTALYDYLKGVERFKYWQQFAPIQEDDFDHVCQLIALWQENQQRFPFLTQNYPPREVLSMLIIHDSGEYLAGDQDQFLQTSATNQVRQQTEAHAIDQHRQHFPSRQTAQFGFQVPHLPKSLGEKIVHYHQQYEQRSSPASYYVKFLDQIGGNQSFQTQILDQLDQAQLTPTLRSDLQLNHRRAFHRTQKVCQDWLNSLLTQSDSTFSRTDLFRLFHFYQPEQVTLTANGEPAFADYSEILTNLTPTAAKVR